MKSRAIIVLGMHRSGTSAFTGVLGLLGVDLGPKLMPASPANESGYWEHLEMVNLHDQLLLALGSSWDDPSRLPAEWWKREVVAACRRKLVDIVGRDFGGSPLWGIKDPRMCRLLPLWKSMMDEIECDPVWVLVTRHPAENLQSLEKRDGFSHEKSGLLWLQHALDAERETRGRNRVVITYNQLFDDTEGTLERVRNAAGVAWPNPAGQIGKFIDPAKRHHQAEKAGELPTWIAAAYEALKAGASGDEAKMRSLIDPVQEAFDIADALYRPVIRDRAVDLEKSLAEAGGQFAHVSDALAETREKYVHTKEKLAAKSAEAKDLKERVRQFERSAGGKLNKLLGGRR